MVILHHMQNGSYHLTELNSIILNIYFVAFHLVPYYACLHSLILVTCFVNYNDLAHVNNDKDVNRANSDII